MSGNGKNDNVETDPINANLPPSYRLALPAEQNRLERELLVQLDRLDPDNIPPPNEKWESSADEAEEDRRHGYAWNIVTMCIKLEALRSLRYRLSPQSQQLVVSGLWSLTMREMSDGYTHAVLPAKFRLKLLRCLCLELERLSDVEVPPSDIVLPWKPVWDAMHQLILRGEDFVIRVPEAAPGVEASLRDGVLNLCSAARAFYPPGAAEEMYAEIEPTLFNKDSNECFIAAGMLVTIPSKDSSALYSREFPRWLELWASVDHRPEWDSLWVRTFCRAQKHAKGFNWAPFVRPMHALAMRILRLPLSPPKSGERGIPYEVSFLSRKRSCLMKTAKMLIGLLGWGEEDSAPESDIVTPFNIPSDEFKEDKEVGFAVVGNRGIQGDRLSGAAVLFLRLIKSFRTLFHPSNLGSWSNSLGSFIAWYTMYLARRIGYEREQGGRGMGGGPALSRADVLAIVREILPVSKQLLYTKGSTTSAESILCNLASISPRETARVIIPLVEEALDPVHSVMHAHQAPSAMRAMSTLIQPLMYPRPYLAEALPILLEWALPGIDPNDQAKTLAASTFFSSVCSWLPLMGTIDRFTISTPPPPPCWADETSCADTEAFEVDSMSAAMERLPEVLPRWGLSLLERLITLVEQSGEASKKLKKPIDYLSTVSSMMGGNDSSMDGEPNRFHAALMHMNAAQDRWQSWVIFSLSMSLFSQMDEQTLQCATRTLMVFCLETSSRDSAKDAANLLRALVAASPKNGLKNILPALAEGLESLPTQTKQWRLRLMSGAVHNAGASTLQHVPLIRHCLDIGLQSSAGGSDKGVLKSACKLLRRILSTLISRYSMDERSHSSGKIGGGCSWQLCAPVTCDSGVLDILWHEPSDEERFVASELINCYVKQPLNTYLDSTTTIEEWRRGLKVATYALNATVWASVEDAENGDDQKFIAVGALGGWGKGAEHVTSLRYWALEFVHSAFHNLFLSINGRTKTPDPKVLKLLMQMGQLAATRRSAHSPSKVFDLRDLLHITWRRGSCGIAFGAVKARLDAADESSRRGSSSSSTVKPLGWKERVKMLLETSHMQRMHWIGFADSQHSQREVVAASVALEHTCKTPLMKCYVDDLFIMSSHPHATVRAAAQQSISNLGRAFESFVNKALPGLTKILTDKSPPHASVTGAIYILAQPRSLQLCTESWPQLQNFLLALCDSETMVNSQPVDYQQKLTARLQILLIRYMRSAEIPPIRTPSDAAICKDLILRFIALGEGGGGSVSSPASPFLRPCDSPNSSGKQQQDDRSSGSRHWRYQLTATCCAIHLLARAGQVSALPVEVWEQVMKSIADTGGEGQPLQQLSLMALGHLFVARISQPEAERIPREVLLDLMLHRSHGGCKGGFMTMLVRAISHIHTKSREDGGGGAESIGGRSSSPQWSLGVGEILSDAKKRYRSALKCTWGNIMLSHHRRNGRGPFVSSHARLIAFLVKACGMEILPALLQAMDTASERAAEEDKNTIQCTIAEVVAGCVWGVLALEGGEVEEHVKDMWSMVIPFVETKLEKANMDMQLLWNQALARMISNRPADALEPLTGMLEIQALKVLRGWRTRDDFATQAKWLFMVQAPLLELPRERATQLGLKLSPELISAASHQFKLCREKIGTCLGIITCFTSVDKEWLLRLAEENTGLGWNLNNNNDPENRFSLSTLSISSGMAVDERPNGNYPSQSTEEEEEEEQKLITTRQDELNNRSQTFIHWILSCLKYGDASVYVLSVIRLLPAVMYAVHSRKVEVNSAGKNCIMQLSTSIRICCRSHLTALPIILSTMTSFTTHESWQVRILAASLCCQFHSEHYLILSSEEASQLEKPIQFLLRDDHREVQDHCCNCLTLQLSFMDFKSVSKLANKLISESDKFVSEAFKKRKRCKVKGVNHVKKSAPSIDTDAKLHQACVLGLSSMVLSHPYEMAPYTAAAVVAIARHADAGGFVKEIVTKVLAEFKRTRTGKDWEEQRQCFTTVQLDAYHDASAVPSYFS